MLKIILNLVNTKFVYFSTHDSWLNNYYKVTYIPLHINSQFLIIVHCHTEKVEIKVETASNKYHFNRIMVYPNNWSTEYQIMIFGYNPNINYCKYYSIKPNNQLLGCNPDFNEPLSVQNVGNAFMLMWKRVPGVNAYTLAVLVWTRSHRCKRVSINLNRLWFI